MRELGNVSAFKMNLLVVILLLNAFGLEAIQRQPHIVFIIADDLGWNDVGFHGSNQIPTPNIDALAYDGIILNNYYVAPICTPSRSALMTGKYPIHTGMQHTVLFGAEPRGLPLSEKLLPEHLKDLGYATHIVGKWHLGSYKLEYTPLRRGFDTHLGYWTGHHDYFDHTAVETSFWGLDMRRGFDPAWDLHGQYSTEIFTKQAESLILSHNSTVPMFLYIAHAAVHSGNPYNPLPVPDSEVQKVRNIENYNRRKYAAMVKMLDDSVGKVVRALRLAKMLQDTIIVFTTDNGGPAEGFNQNAASNWPLRGVKNTLWEGGVRGAGLIWSKTLESNRRVSDQLFHITDWLPTLYTAAGGKSENLANLDGFDGWAALSCNLEPNRTQVLHNIDDIYGNAALTIGEWKIVKGSTYNGTWDGWYGPSGINESLTHDFEDVAKSMASKAIHYESEGPSDLEMRIMRKSSRVECAISPADAALLDGSVKCDPFNSTCLFNIKADPCERHNLAYKYREIATHLENELANLNKTAVPPGNLPVDPRGNPNLWGHTWTHFGDYSVSTNNVN